eukprot:3845528-Prorocentrum_lima.AAC.1
MTSSLVGSEMCIRDRCIGWESSCVALCAKDIVEGKSRPKGHDTVNIWTVSYTHLTLPTICSV